MLLQVQCLTSNFSILIQLLQRALTNFEILNMSRFLLLTLRCCMLIGVQTIDDHFEATSFLQGIKGREGCLVSSKTDFAPGFYNILEKMHTYNLWRPYYTPWIPCFVNLIRLWSLSKFRPLGEEQQSHLKHSDTQAWVIHKKNAFHLELMDGSISHWHLEATGCLIVEWMSERMARSRKDNAQTMDQAYKQAQGSKACGLSFDPQPGPNFLAPPPHGSAGRS